MAFSPDDMRAALVGSGARPNLFDIQLIFPPVAADSAASQAVTLLARAASIPPSTLGLIELSYFGRKLKYPGDTTFPEWTITVQNDENFTIWNAFTRWKQGLNGSVSNLRSPIAATIPGYQTDIVVRQYSKIGGPAIKQWTLVGAYPQNVGDIQIDWSVNDTIEEFPVTLQYQWWTDPQTTS